MQEQVAIDQEGKYLESKPIRSRMMYRASRMSSTPSAPGHERSIRWLADTGCPIDLVGLNELSAGERSLVKRTGRTHALQTANGTASTLGNIAADMQDIDEVIDAHVMQNTPSFACLLLPIAALVLLTLVLPVLIQMRTPLSSKATALCVAPKTGEPMP